MMLITHFLTHVCFNLISNALYPILLPSSLTMTPLLQGLWILRSSCLEKVNLGQACWPSTCSSTFMFSRSKIVIYVSPSSATLSSSSSMLSLEEPRTISLYVLPLMFPWCITPSSSSTYFPLFFTFVVFLSLRSSSSLLLPLNS